MTSHLPWFTTWGIEFSRPIENVFSIVSEVNGNRKNNRWLMVNYDVLASEVHLWNAWYSLRCNERTEKMVAKTPDTEFIRLLSGTHQINKAFERAGVSEGDSKAWIVFLPILEFGNGFGNLSIPSDIYNSHTKDALRLIECLGGKMLAKRPIATDIGLSRLGVEYYGNKSTTEMENLFISHMGLSDLR
ncbi:MAG: hypothetical protein CMA12_07040 [Euryarchaeota archaeon]|nr:hypothetical protein [Euryarchaeota archaeon]